MEFDDSPAMGGRVLIVLSHLRWDWVWQRPQHVVSRMAERYAATWFVEEPVRAPVASPRLRHEQCGPIHRAWLEIPEDSVGCEFAGPECAGYARLLRAALGDAADDCDVWLYGPSALAIGEALRPRLLVYDMMDDLAAFADGGEGVRELQWRALRQADLVLAGGRSLYRSALSVRGDAPTVLFPSGVDIDHYAISRTLRRPNERPVAGYVGVIDERMDLTLLGDLALKLDDWDIHLVGPTAKIDPRSLPTAPNLYYPGMRTYEQLPATMAAFDVALMPFALNEATRSISPTKTLEYLAAGLPVVSTMVPDVVADWAEVVHFASDAAEFAEACRTVRTDPVELRDMRAAPRRRRHDWDTIVSGMADQMDLVMAGRFRAVAA